MVRCVCVRVSVCVCVCARVCVRVRVCLWLKTKELPTYRFSLPSPALRAWWNSHSVRASRVPGVRLPRARGCNPARYPLHHPSGYPVRETGWGGGRAGAHPPGAVSAVMTTHTGTGENASQAVSGTRRRGRQGSAAGRRDASPAPTPTGNRIRAWRVTVQTERKNLACCDTCKGTFEAGAL